MAVSRQIDFLLAGLIDSDGLPLSAGKVETYNAGTLTSKTTWTDQSKTTPAANPIILDSLGQAKIFGDGAYKFIIKRSDNTTLTTLDNIIINEQSTSTIAGTTAGTSTAYTLTVSPSPTGYSNGQTIQFFVHTTNGINPTINLNGLGAIPIFRPTGSAIPTGVLQTGILYTGIYYSGNLIIQDCSTGWMNWVPTITGYSANPAGGIYRYCINSMGNECSVFMREVNNGTSNSATTQYTAPLTAVTISNMQWRSIATYVDNTVLSTIYGTVVIQSGSSDLLFGKTATTSADFTSSGGKRITNAYITYEI